MEIDIGAQSSTKSGRIAKLELRERNVWARLREIDILVDGAAYKLKCVKLARHHARVA